MDPSLNTIFYFFGTSGAGKSTRVYALVRFLESIGEHSTDYLYKNGVTVGREYLNSFYIIGREINRNGLPVWQGVDIWVDELIDGKDVGNMFSFFCEAVKKRTLVLDSAAIIRSYRSRPFHSETYPVDFNIYCKAYWFDNFEDYRNRIAGRSGGKLKDEKSQMWKTNKSFYRQEILFNDEIKKCKHPERYEFHRGYPDEPIWTIGESVLIRTGNEKLVPEFKTFSEQYLLEISSKSSVMEESLF